MKCQRNNTEQHKKHLDFLEFPIFSKTVPYLINIKRSIHCSSIKRALHNLISGFKIQQTVACYRVDREDSRATHLEYNYWNLMLTVPRPVYAICNHTYNYKYTL